MPQFSSIPLSQGPYSRSETDDLLSTKANISDFDDLGLLNDFSVNESGELLFKGILVGGATETGLFFGIVNKFSNINSLGTPQEGWMALVESDENNGLARSTYVFKSGNWVRLFNKNWTSNSVEPTDKSVLWIDTSLSPPQMKWWNNTTWELIASNNNEKGIQTFEINKSYVSGALVINNNKIYSAKINFTSGSSFSESNWNIVGGDMLLSTYDKNSNGIVDKAETLEGMTATISDINKLQGISSNIQNQIDSIHTHSNLTLLNSYTESNTDIVDAIAKKHEHLNISILNGFEEDISGSLLYKGTKIGESSGSTGQSTVIVNNIDERNSINNLSVGLRCHVINATSDLSVSSGWAEYLYSGTEWVKTAEKESIDLHIYTNQTILDATTEAFTTELKSSILGINEIDGGTF